MYLSPSTKQQIFFQEKANDAGIIDKQKSEIEKLRTEVQSLRNELLVVQIKLGLKPKTLKPTPMTPPDVLTTPQTKEYPYPTTIAIPQT